MVYLNYNLNVWETVKLLDYYDCNADNINYIFISMLFITQFLVYSLLQVSALFSLAASIAASQFAHKSGVHYGVWIKLRG